MFFSRKGNRLADMICGRSPELIVDLEGVGFEFRSGACGTINQTFRHNKLPHIQRLLCIG